MPADLPALARIWQWLEEVPDPELPAVSIVELGIVREVAWAEDGACQVTVTPTYSGCPAASLIKTQISQCLQAHGLREVRCRTRLAPAWSSDWVSASAREKLRACGIAPPPPCSGGWPELRLPACGSDANAPAGVDCPRCGASDSELVSAFGATPCKSLHRCRHCLEPFEHFKCH
ncbi:MAG TPA: 1,2-phenylacetyl-CoA epoxidase subunit PaaD [Stenotrophomonas sp.]|nr:1,2-phenylacetyl-CoA epoxidase subunit PaaD [Stenotrophomonas sp.]